jgi:hypothetical protein
MFHSTLGDFLIKAHICNGWMGKRKIQSAMALTETPWLLERTDSIRHPQGIANRVWVVHEVRCQRHKGGVMMIRRHARQALFEIKSLLALITNQNSKAIVCR